MIIRARKMPLVLTGQSVRFVGSARFGAGVGSSFGSVPDGSVLASVRFGRFGSATVRFGTVRFGTVRSVRVGSVSFLLFESCGAQLG